MKNFTYRSLEEKENLEDILRERKRRINRQQLISATILIIIIGLVALYYMRKAYYTEFDGFVHTDLNLVRTPMDIYVDSVFVKTGDVVFPGDTLYSYYSIDGLLHLTSYSNDEPGIISRHRDYNIKLNSARQNAAVLQTTISELRRQISEVDQNISFGLADIGQKASLQRQLAENEAKLRAQRAEISVLTAAINDTRPSQRAYDNKDSLRHSLVFDDARSGYMRSELYYNIASDSSIIVNVLAPRHMVFFEQEEILSCQHLRLQANNLQIWGYIPVDKMDRVNNKTKAEVIVNDDVSFRAHMGILGIRTQVIPENLRSYFSKQNVAVMAIFHVNDGQRIPFWTVASGLPVKIRVKNFDIWGVDPDPNDYLWFTTGDGLTPGSLKYHFEKQDLKYVDKDTI